MLVLTRKVSEEIKIGNDIVIKVIQTGKGTIKLGIEAPRHIRVLRGELTPFEDDKMEEKVELPTLKSMSASNESTIAPLQRELERFRLSKAICEIA